MVFTLKETKRFWWMKRRGRARALETESDREILRTEAWSHGERLDLEGLKDKKQIGDTKYDENEDGEEENRGRLTENGRRAVSIKGRRRRSVHQNSYFAVKSSSKLSFITKQKTGLGPTDSGNFSLWALLCGWTTITHVGNWSIILHLLPSCSAVKIIFLSATFSVTHKLTILDRFDEK